MQTERFSLRALHVQLRDYFLMIPCDSLACNSYYTRNGAHGFCCPRVGSWMLSRGREVVVFSLLANSWGISTRIHRNDCMHSPLGKICCISVQHHFLCNISYVVIALSTGKNLKYTTNIVVFLWLICPPAWLYTLFCCQCCWIRCN